jgi:aspartyl-tRNA(Asn)/glutamyl-tRNA(Gln) amidotransferase subunit C
VPTFSADDVYRLAHLARLELTPDEVTAFTRQLDDILSFVRQIQSVDTSAVEAVTAASAEPPLRADERQPSLDRETVLAAAPDHDPATGLIKVPRVLGS